MTQAIKRLLEYETPVLVARPDNPDVYHVPQASGQSIQSACGQRIDRVAIRSLATLLRTHETRLCGDCRPATVDGYPADDPRFKRVTA